MEDAGDTTSNRQCRIKCPEGDTSRPWSQQALGLGRGTVPAG